MTLAVAHEHRALDRVLELADVARPVIAREHVDGRRRDPLDVLPVLDRVLREEVVGQQHDVRLPLAKRRREDREHVQPVEQVLAERAGRHQLFERPVGGRDEAHVDADAVRAAEPLDLALLQRAQQLHLRRHVHVADLVEEQRAALGQLEAALLERVGAGERALLVAEQLGFDQAAGQRRAAHLDERLLRARRVVVDGVRDHLLAGPRLARG